MQKDRKKEHKKIIKSMRRWNEILSSDDYIGLKRFRVDSVCEWWNRYGDNSGGTLNLVLKITDTWTSNVGFFIVNNYDFNYKMSMYINDFLIRCSSGTYGHYPQLHYVAYDIHEIIPYAKSKKKSNPFVFEDEQIINKWNWLKCLDRMFEGKM